LLIDRPYSRYTAKQLAEILTKTGVAEQDVRALLSELQYRKSSPQNQTTAAMAEAWLERNAKKHKEPSKTASQNLLLKTIGKPRSLEETNHQTVSVSSDQVGEMGSFQEKSLEFRPSLLRRIFGAEVIKASTINGVEVISGRFSNLILPQPLPDDYTYVIKPALFTSQVSLTVGGEVFQARVGGSQKTLFVEYLNSRRYVPEAQRLAAELDQMMGEDSFLNNRRFNRWSRDVEALIKGFTAMRSLEYGWVARLAKSLGAADTRRHQHNTLFIDSKKAEFSNFFSHVESSPLTERQIQAVLIDEDAVLVNAGAGTGKTSTVIGKIGYLVKSGIAAPEEILALAYGRDAATELRERVKDRLGFDVEVRTFHSLGLELTQQARGHRIEIADVASDERSLLALLARLFQEIWEEPSGRKLIQEFFSAHRYPAKYLEDFDSEKDYKVYLRKFEPRTLKGELVKSFEELLIADWLLTNGVSYEYERPYEINLAGGARRQYRPDFYLSDYGIYLEHFGVGKNGETAPGIDSVHYQAQMSWKRELHTKHNTTLLETYSWQRREGVLFQALEDALQKHGVKLIPGGGDEVRQLIQAGAMDKKMVALFKDFLVAFKENQLAIDDLSAKISSLPISDKSRATCFFEIFKKIYLKYQSYLNDRKVLDFSDCIQDAVIALASGKIKLNFKRVIVDEYQDISNGRFNLLREILRQQEDCRLMAVGDDWQSIYGFTGSDIEKSTEFVSHFEGATVVPLDRTFRFTTPIISVSSDFIQRNPDQLRKQVEGRESTVKRPVHLMCASDKASVSLDAILAEIASEVPPKKKWKVFLLGRYNFLRPPPDELKRLTAAFSTLELEFASIHASKGREADAVVLLDLVGGRYGFPGSIERDPLMNLVIPGEDSFPDAEERRVLYVALTRARSKVVISARTDLPSSFLQELQLHPVVTSDELNRPDYVCKDCSGRLLLRFPNRVHGYAWQCEFHPYCPGEARMCGVCKSAPLVSAGQCSNAACGRNSPKSLAKR
jgi:DNA helicase-4